MNRKKKGLVFVLCFLVIFHPVIILHSKTVQSTIAASPFGIGLDTQPVTSSAIEPSTQPATPSAIEPSTQPATPPAIEPSETPQPTSTPKPVPLNPNVKLKNLSLDFISEQKGFSPFYLNRLYFHFFISGEVSKKGTTYVTVKIYNKKDKLIFTSLDKVPIKGSQILEYEWDGKPSKKNEANLSSSNYVKPGNYYLEITVITNYPNIKNGSGKHIENTENGAIHTLTKRKEFKVLKPGISSSYGNDKNLVPKVSNSTATDYMADRILNQIITINMSNEEKIRAVYNWIVKNGIHIHGYKEYYSNPKYDKELLAQKALVLKEKNKKRIQNGKVGQISTQPNSKVYHFLRYRRGNCYYWADTFQYLLERLGFEAKSIQGAYINSTGTRPPHAFNTVKLNTSWYWYDANIDFIIGSKTGNLQIRNYMLSEAEFKKRHVIPII